MGWYLRRSRHCCLYLCVRLHLQKSTCVCMCNMRWYIYSIILPMHACGHGRNRFTRPLIRRRRRCPETSGYSLRGHKDGPARLYWYALASMFDVCIPAPEATYHSKRRLFGGHWPHNFTPPFIFRRRRCTETTNQSATHRPPTLVLCAPQGGGVYLHVPPRT